MSTPVEEGTIKPKPCPFCAAAIRVADTDGMMMFICDHCDSETFYNSVWAEDAIAKWNARKNYVSVAGGRATAGISTKKKRRACRRNAKAGRRALKQADELAETASTVILENAIRLAPAVELKRLAALGMSKLKEREQDFRNDPELWELYKMCRTAHPS